MRDVCIIGIGQTPIGELWERSLRHLAFDALHAAVEEAGIERPDALFVGNMLAPRLNAQQQLGALIADFCGWRGIEAVTVEAACASGGAAFQAAVRAVASGMSEVAAVVGVDGAAHARSLLRGRRAAVVKELDGHGFRLLEHHFASGRDHERRVVKPSLGKRVPAAGDQEALVLSAPVEDFFRNRSVKGVLAQNEPLSRGMFPHQPVQMRQDFGDLWHFQLHTRQLAPEGGTGVGRRPDQVLEARISRDNRHPSHNHVPAAIKRRAGSLRSVNPITPAAASISIAPRPYTPSRENPHGHAAGGIKLPAVSHENRR